MNELRYRYEDRFAETKGYDGFLADKDELNNFFEQKIKDKFGDHSTWVWTVPSKKFTMSVMTVTFLYGMKYFKG